MPSKPRLAMTLEDYRSAGGMPDQVLVDNPGKALAETMDDEALLQFLREQFSALVELHELAQGGSEAAKRALPQERDFMASNLAYLRKIGRLPDEFKDLDPAVKFAL